ncbi:MAG TPA: hypothetical protein PLO89_11595 [Spirochaetota bacterium]|nr:hypothetical protein [Spirochaetota bacterium]
MKKTLFFSFFLFSLNYFSFSYENPFWSDSSNNIINISKNSRPNKMVFESSFNYQYSMTMGDSFYFLNGSTINLLNFLSLNDKFKISYDGLKTANLGLVFSPLTFFRINLNYNVRFFMNYNTIEHNILFDTELIFNRIKYFFAGATGGFDFRFSDLDLYEKNKIYNKNILFNLIFYFKIYFFVNPISFLSFGFSMGNKTESEVHSFNYLQFEFINYFHLPKNISIFINSGFGYAGSLPFAGVIERFWIHTGLRYEINFNF